MVATNFKPTNLGGGWLKYLVLSLIANLLIASVITISESSVISQETPVLKVKLMALAAPAFVSEPMKPLSEKMLSSVVAPEVVTEFQSELSSLPMPVANETESGQIKEETKMMEKEFPQLQSLAVTGCNGEGEEAVTIIHEAQHRKQTPPVYPRRALKLGQQGTVTLHAKIMSNGLPGELKVAKSSGHRLLDQAAFEAVKGWEFEPENVNGRAVVCWVRVPVRFVIR